MRLTTVFLPLLIALCTTAAAQTPAPVPFQEALRKIIADEPSGFLKFRGAGHEGTFSSRITLPGTFSNGIVTGAGGKTAYFEAYIRENMSESESIRLQAEWAAFLGKALPDYIPAPTVRITKDFHKTVFTRKGPRPVTVSLYRDKNAGFSRLSLAVKGSSPFVPLGPPRPPVPKGTAAPPSAKAAPPATKATDADKELRGKAADADTNLIIARVEAMRGHIGRIILARKNGFREYRGRTLDSAGPGNKTMAVPVLHFPGRPPGAESIAEEDKKAVYKVTFSGPDMPAAAMLAYRHAITDHMKRTGYTLLPNERNPDVPAYSILCDGKPVATFSFNRRKAEALLMVRE